MKPIASIQRWLACTSARAGVANVSSPALIFGFAILGTSAANAANIQWDGATASYNTPVNWAGDVLPTADDNAFVSNSGTVQILPADPTWTVNDVRTSNGIYTQTGSRLRLGAWFRMAELAGTTGTYNLNGGKVEVYTGNIHVGEAGDGVLNFTSGDIYQRGGFGIVGNRGQGPNTTGTGVVNHSGGTWNSSGELWVGHGHTADAVFGTYNLTGGTLNLSNWTSIGRNGADGEFNMTSGTINKSQETSGQLVVGIFDGGIGSTGHFKQDGGTVKLGAELWLGQGANSAGNLASGTYDLNGGLIDMNNWIAVGREGGTGVLNVNGGTLRKLGGGGSFTLTGTGTVNQTGGLVDIRAGSLMIAENNNAIGTYNLSGTGVVEVPQTIIVVTNDATITGKLNLTAGGTLKTGRLFKQGTHSLSTAGATFDGGILVATAHEPNFISGLTQAEIVGDGLTLDTNGFETASPQAFSGSGTLKKVGRGTFGLTGATSIENIEVNAGTLDVDAALTGFTVKVADGASLSGTGTIAGDVTLGATAGSSLVATSTAATPLAIDGGLQVHQTRIDFANHDVTPATPFLVATCTGLFTGNFTLGRPGTVVVDDQVTPVTVTATVQAPRTLTWTGSANSNWDIFSTVNFTNGGSPSAFGQGDTVNLGNAAGTNPLVLKGPLRPAAIAVDNTNTITLQGTPADDITGSVVITKAGAGKLIVGLDTSLNPNQTTPTVVPSTVTVNAGELQIGNGGTTGSLGRAAVTNNALLSFNFSSDEIFANSINGTGGSIAKSGAGQLTLTGAVAYTGTTTINSGRLVFQTPAVIGTGAVTNNGELEITNNTGALQNVDSVISGTGKLFKSGTQEVWLRAANTFTGDVDIIRGPGNSLNITHAQALGTTAGKTIVRGFNGTGGQFVNIRALTAGGTTIAEPFELIADAFGRAGLRHEGGTQVLTLTGPITVASTGMSSVQIWNSSATSTLNVQGDISGSLNGANLFLRGSTGPINVTGSITIADQGDVFVTDNAVVRLGAAGKTYQGFRTNIAFGQLRTVLNDTLPTTQPVLMCQNATSGAKWILGDGTTPVSQTISGLSSQAVAPSSGIVGSATTESTLTVNQDANTDFNLPLGGSGSNENKLALVKAGKGRLTLGAVNTLTGTITVSGGTLLVNGTTAGSLATVQAGATLGGTSRVGGFTATGNASATANISPGNNGIGTFSASPSNAVFGPYSAFNWQLQDWNGATDKVTTTSSAINITATSANPVTIRILPIGNVTNFTEANKSFTIATGGFGLQNFAVDKFVIDSSGFTAGTGTWKVRQDGNNIILDYTAGAATGSYATWAIAKGIPGEPEGGDFDKDGLVNLLEYGLGLDPKVGNGTPGTFSSGSASFTKGTDAVANGDVTYSIETSPTLGVAPSPWTPVTPTVNNATTISYTLPTGEQKVFVRLVVRKNP